MEKIRIHFDKDYYTLWAKEVDQTILIDFWEKLNSTSIAKITFYEHLPQNFADFYDFINSSQVDVRFVGKFGHGLLAMYWLNNQLGKAVMIHFCVLKHAFIEQVAIGKYVVQSLLLAENNGEKIISTLFGLTPKAYGHAINFIQKLGFEIMGVLPKSCYFKTKNKYVDGIVSKITKENLT